MTQIWPPSPCVEDEEVALSREYMLDAVLSQANTEDQPASSRGSVNQYPIILDSHDQPQLPETKDAEAVRTTPRDEQGLGVNTEKRFVLVPSQTGESGEVPLPPSESLHRSKSTTQIPLQDASRGRPQVTRIHTDLGAGLASMQSDRRRGPSPYAQTPPGLLAAVLPEARRKDTLLSPRHAQEPKRTVSTHLGPRGVERDSSDSDQTTKSRRRPERSRSRAARQSFSQSDRSESDKIKNSKFDKHDENANDKFFARAHRYRSPAPRPGGFTGYAYTGQDHITPPATPKPNGESARSSGLDQSVVQEQASTRHIPKRVNTDSPNTSSAEESYGRRLREQDGARSGRPTRSRRNSRLYVETEERPTLTRARSQRRERPARDDTGREHFSSDEQPRRGTKTPVSARAPITMEGFESAFAANQNKRQRDYDIRSRHVSPLASPARSPPQTPRGERSSADYFESNHQPSKLSKQRSRPPSIDETNLKDLKHVSGSLLGVATLGASLAKVIPALSRSTTSPSIDTPSSSSQSRPSSGQRSRKPSPVLEHTQQLYQSLSRANSVTSREDGMATHTTTFTVHEDRAIPKTAQYMPVPPESPRTTLRASSYSHSPEHSRPPAPFRAQSSTTIQGGNHQPPLPATAHQTLLPTPLNLEPASVTNGPVRSNSMPTCPRSRPIAGLQDWYTIRDVPFLDICPTCMSFLGSTRFRDHFIPSHGKDPRVPIMCAMNHPWLRIAWQQSLKQERKDLLLVWDIVRAPPTGTKPCAGGNTDLRRWYHLTDPRNKRPVDNFDICSACVRNIDLIFPNLQFQMFDRPQDKKEVEKICNMNPKNRHFLRLLSELERLSDRTKDTVGHRDFQDFVDFVRRITRNRECVKDALLATQSWHFINELPEFTICEECFEEVVWPLRDRPIARDVSKTLKLVPTHRKSNLLPGTSCQLYSQRMRDVFREAVRRNDYERLRQAAQYRYHMEHRLQEMHKLYQMDQKAGIDRGAEIEKNILIWKSIE